MVSSAARTAREYLDSLPEDRRDEIAAVRSVILDNLPAGFEEGMQFGMLSYQVPLAVYPDTYNGQAASIVCLASQKGYMSLYLMGVYTSPERRRRFEQAFRKAGKKLDMGKSCVRFKRVEDLPLNVIGDTIASISMDDYLAIIRKAEALRSSRPKGKPAAAKSKAKAKPKPKAKSKAPVKAARKPAASSKLRSASKAKARGARGR